jgi:hypothetical protein
VAPPAKEPSNPLLVEDKLWDVRWDNTYPTTRYDLATKTYKMWYNAFVSWKEPHPSWNFPKPITAWKGHTGATLYAESDDGIHWTKPELGVVAYPWNGTSKTQLKNKTNIVLMGGANPDRGVMYDLPEKNASRRYKAFGSFNDNLCRGKDSKTPKTATDGTLWPPCHNLGVAYSSDGIHFDNAADMSKNANAPGLDTVGQNDGALDLAMFDAALEGGTYWGLVRLDVAGPPNPRPWGGDQVSQRLQVESAS